MKRTLFLFALCLLVSSAGNADAISVTGDATLVSPPSSVETGTGTGSIVFAEQSIVLSLPLLVDISAPGAYNSVASLTPGTIAAGTDVSSFYLHSFNSATSAGTVYSGSITFSTPILGVEALTSSLTATNSILGSPSTIYFTSNNAQGFEFGTQIDSLTISGNTLSYLDETFGAPDDLRIITAAPTATATPEPSSLLLLGTALLALFGAAQSFRSPARHGAANR
jgi:PEP-CTERM motif